MSKTANDPTRAEPVRTGFETAIIGLSFRFPEAENSEQLWANLAGGVESITRFSFEEMEAAGIPREQYQDPSYVPVSSVLPDYDCFDAQLFGYSPREAQVLDPQQRWFLQCCWEALEAGGYHSRDVADTVGVFAGVRMSFYLRHVYSNVSLMRAVGDLQAQIANDKDYVAPRVSYKLGLGGPSINVQSACSTALSAVHLACQALIAGDCDLALAGASAVKPVQPEGYLYQQGGNASPDGHCRSFDAQAGGTMFGNGVGVLLLKRLEDALADGDPIRAVVRGSAVTNDGDRRVGFTAPGVDGQSRVVKAALRSAELSAEAISYLEAHGTATALGDPIEVAALSKAFRESGYHGSQTCALGSIKTNFGHLGAAAGVAGIAKTVLALEHRQIPPHLHFEQPHPQIDFASSPFFVNTELRDWQVDEGPRRAGVSAFGIGGTNGHVILEEAPFRAPSPPARGPQLLVLSTRTSSALEESAGRLAEHLEAHPDLNLADAAFTLQVGRRALDRRAVVVAEDAAEAVRNLRTLGAADLGRAGAEPPSVAFLFSGQGAQYPGAGQDLYQAGSAEDAAPWCARFREVVDRCAESLKPELDRDLRGLLFPELFPELCAGEGDLGEPANAAVALAETRITQPALFVIELALAESWRSLGVEPEAMLGHSIGEYVAAHLAGVLSLEDALRLVAARGRVMQALPAGAMLSVPLSEEELRPLLGAGVDLAVINGSRRCVASGPEDSVAGLAAKLEERGTPGTVLKTSHAFHSAMMEPALPAFREVLETVRLQAPTIPVVSNVTGTWLTAAEATDPEYWLRHLRDTVRFDEGLGTLLQEPRRALLEVGPGEMLASLARSRVRAAAAKDASADVENPPLVLSSTPHPKNADQPAAATLLRSFGRLWLRGFEPSWKLLYGPVRRQRQILPTYPFARDRFYVKLEYDLQQSADLSRQDLEDWFHVPHWRPELLPDLGTEVVPGDDWLLFFSPEDALGEAVAERLEQSEARVLRVAPGPAFESLGSGRFALRPGERADFAALLEEAQDGDERPLRILYGWPLAASVGATPGTPGYLAELQDQEELAFYGLLSLSQALADYLTGRDRDTALVALTAEAQSVQGEAVRYPGLALALGPVKTLPSEVPSLRARAVDLFEGHAADDPGSLATLLIAEAEAAVKDATGAVPVVAYRQGKRRPKFLAGSAGTVRRFLQEVSPAPLAQTLHETLPLRASSTVLITGGLGGIGLELARALAEQAQGRDGEVNLVLTGRSALPPREEWPDSSEAWAQTPASLKTKLEAVLALEDLGAEVLVVAADVADGEAMGTALRLARDRFGGIHGVIHSAGVPGGGVIQLKARETAAAVLAPKVQGTAVLLASLAQIDSEPDFLVLCSSTIAVLGGLGQVDYCAANNYLDACARAYGAEHPETLAVSVNWGAWAEVGMAVDAVEGAAGLTSQGAAFRPPEDAVPQVSGPHPVAAASGGDGQALTFAMTLGAANSWLLDEHRIAGRPALPGTGQLELVRAAVAGAAGEAPTGPLVLSGVLFPEPFLVPDGQEAELRIVLEPSPEAGAAGWRFRTESGEAGSGAKVHVLGEAWYSAAPEEAGSESLEELEQHCSASYRDFRKDSLERSEGLVYWGPRWGCLDSSRTGEGEGLAYLELGEEFVPDLEVYPLHPALLDVATALGSQVATDGSFLPLSYGRLTVYRPLTRRIVSYLRVREGSSTGGETLSLDIRILDPEGQVLVDIERFAMKRVRERQPATQTLGVGTVASGIRPAEGSEAFLRLLSRGISDQVAVSARHLGALLAQVAAARREAREDADSQGGPRHARPELGTRFRPPESAGEVQIAKVWQDLLGIDQVGADDNFFELGGDSVLGIQVVSRLREKGYAVAAEQLFEHQTVSELASVLESTSEEGSGKDTAQGVQGTAAGEPPPVLVEIDPDDLELALGLEDATDQVDDVYPLSPLQLGMVYHAYEEPGDGLYIELLSARLKGSVDLEAFEAAWAALLARLPVLRTAVVMAGAAEPVQVILSQVETPITVLDWREDWSQLAEAQRPGHLEALSEEIRLRGFELDRAPLMSVHLIRLDEEEWHLIWAHHHLLMDGWSSPLTTSEFFEVYDARVTGREPRLAERRPFRDYIAWLQRQDLAAARAFWTENLAGVSAATPVATDRRPQTPDPAEGSQGARRASLDVDASRVLEALGQGLHVTLNNLFQGAWALVLAQDAGLLMEGDDGAARDVIFGTTLSGRPSGLDGVDTMIGLFINVLPLRLRLDPAASLADFLADVQARSRAIMAYDFTPLPVVQGASELPPGQSLFDTVVAFWNFPGRPEEEPAGGLELSMGGYHVETTFPLSIRVMPEKVLGMKAVFDPARLSGAWVEEVLARVTALLARFPELVEGEVSLRDVLRQGIGTLEETPEGVGA